VKEKSKAFFLLVSPSTFFIYFGIYF